MKKIFYYICAALLTLGLSSCVKEEPLANENTLTLEAGQMIITATVGEGETSKSTFNGDDQNGYKVLWSEGDQIKIFNQANSQYYTYTLLEGAGTRIGKFTGTQLPAGSYTATCGTGFSYRPSSCTFDSAQNAYTADIASWVPMTAKVTVSAEGEASGTNFKNATGILRLNIEGIGTVKQIKITTDQYISGAATLTNGALTINQSGSGIYKYVTVDCGDSGVELIPEGTYIYISLPKSTYTGVKIEFSDFKGNTCTKTLKADKTLNIARAQITPVSLSVPLSIRGTAKRTGGIDVNWVQLWENGPKFAEYNIGVTDGKAESYGEFFTYDDNDTATDSWGSNWRMPTYAELTTLANVDGSNKCESEWIYNYNNTGINGRIFKGKDYYSINSVFLPASGYCVGPVEGRGDAGFYWSATPNGPSSAIYMHFNPDFMEVKWYYRSFAQSARAVLAE